MQSWARFYDHPMPYEPYTTGFEHIRVLLEEVRRRWRGGRVLEAGLGTGYMSIWLSLHGVTATGLDLDPEIVARANYTACVLHAPSRFVEGDIRDIGALFPGETFDVIFSQGVLEHFDDETIRRLVAVELEHARHVLISVPSPSYPSRDVGDERLLAVERWLAILAPLGTRVESAEYRGEQPGGAQHVLLALTGRAASGEPAPPPLEESVAPQLVWESHLLKPSGYASMARNILLGLDEMGVDLALREYQGHLPTSLSEEDHDRILSLMRKPVRPRAVLVHHMPPIGALREDSFANIRAAWPGMGRYIGSTMFETDRLPRSWLPCFEAMDEVWVPTRFQKAAFTASGADPRRLYVTPNGIDPRRYEPESVRPLRLSPRAGFNFLSVFEFSSRKGWDVLVRAFLEEFAPGDDVSLTLLVYALHYSPGRGGEKPRDVILRYIRHRLGRDPAKGPPVHVVDRMIPPRDMPAVYAAYDAFVLPTRGEGWGMPTCEAMAMGLPVASTRFGGSLEFLDDDVGWLIEVERMTPVSSEMVCEIPHFEGSLWAEPCVRSTRAAMRAIVEDRDRARETGARARRRILSRFTFRQAAATVRERLGEVFHARWTRRPPRAAAPEAAHAVPAGPGPAGAGPAIRIAWEGDLLGWDRRARWNRDVTSVLERTAGLVLERRAPGTPATDGPAPDLLVSHAPDPPARDGRARRHVWYAAFDLGGLPRGWTAAAARFDEVWVPSRATRRILADAGIPARRVRVLEPGIDTGRFHPGAPPLELPTGKRFRFLAIAWEPRREGLDLLLDLYDRQFRGAEDVALVLQVPGEGTAAEGFRRRARADRGRGAPEVVLLDSPLDDADMPRLYAACDVLVAPFRAASYGLALREAMASGRPVIGTAGGPGADLIGETNGFPVPPLRHRSAADRGRVEGRPEVLVPTASCLARVLRHVFEHPEDARRRGLEAARLAAERFSLEAAGAAVARRAAELCSGAEEGPSPIRLLLPAGASVPPGLAVEVVEVRREPERGGFSVQVAEEAEATEDDLIAVASGGFRAEGDPVARLAAELAEGGHAAVLEGEAGVLAVLRAGSLRTHGGPDPVFKGPAAILEAIRAARAAGLDVRAAAPGGVAFTTGDPAFGGEREAVRALARSGEALASGDLEGALDGILDALRLKPEYPAALRESGRLLRRLRAFPEAIGAFETLISLSPADATAHREAGELLLEAKLPKDAEPCFRRAARLDPWDPAVHRGLAYVHYDLGDLAGALECMRSALRLDPGSAEIAVECAGILEAAGRREEARAFLRSYAALNPDPELDALLQDLEEAPALPEVPPAPRLRPAPVA